MSKGVMEFSRRTNQSHYTNYNNAYKSFTSIQEYLKKTGYENLLLDYLRGGTEDDEQDSNRLE